MFDLADIKKILGIECIEDDDTLQAILYGIEDIIKKKVGDLSYGEKVENFKIKAIKSNTLCLSFANPDKILEINGVSFEDKIKGEDYYIFYDGTCVIKDISDYYNDLGFLEIKYNAGYNSIPKDLVLSVANYVGYIFNKEYGKDIVGEKLGPRSITFIEGDFSNSGKSIQERNFYKSLSKYIPLCLKVF